MISNIYHSVVYQPLYNGLILLMDTIPWADAGIVVILFTIVVKLVLFPLSKKAVTTQIQMKKIEPELAVLREQYKDDKQEQARKTLALYKEKGIRPFMSVLLIFIQLPIIFGLYRIFWHSGLPTVDSSLLYRFVTEPEYINMVFLGLVDISSKSIPLAVIVAISTFLQAKLMAPKAAEKPLSHGGTDSFKHDLARSMRVQMIYVFPFIAGFISYGISAAISLYWITSNLFTIGQELVLKKTLKK